MTIDLSTAKALWKATIDGAGEARIPFSSIEMAQSLAVLRQEFSRGVDDSDLMRAILGDRPGGSLLSMVLWQAGRGHIPMEEAWDMARLLLDNGANPNAVVNRHKPIDMLVVGVYNSDQEPRPDISPLLELLVAHGMNHDAPGAYSVQDLANKLRHDGVKEGAIALLVQGPEAIKLDKGTDPATAQQRRRCL